MEVFLSFLLYRIIWLVNLESGQVQELIKQLQVRSKDKEGSALLGSGWRWGLHWILITAPSGPHLQFYFPLRKNILFFLVVYVIFFSFQWRLSNNSSFVSQWLVTSKGSPWWYSYSSVSLKSMNPRRGTLNISSYGFWLNKSCKSIKVAFSGEFQLECVRANRVESLQQLWADPSMG